MKILKTKQNKKTTQKAEVKSPGIKIMCTISYPTLTLIYVSIVISYKVLKPAKGGKPLLKTLEFI